MAIITIYRVIQAEGGYVEYTDITKIPEGSQYEVFERDTTPQIDYLQIETDKYIKRIKDGQEAYSKISAEFRLAKLSGQISEETHGYIESTLIPVRNEVLAGQWISAKIILESIGAVNIGQELYDRLHGQITNYINENY